MGATFYIVLTLIACCLKEGHGVASFINLPTGNVVANFEGAVNATTLTCNAFDDQGNQITTSWSVANLEGVPSIRRLTPQDTLFSFGGDLIPNTTISYLNQVTIVNWTSALDGATLYCGDGNDLQASVLLKLYRPPNLQDNFIVMLQEKTEVNIPVDLRQDSPAFPEPTVFTWMRNGQAPLRSGLTTTYSNVTFDSVMRSDAGNYTVTATNFLLNDSNSPIGSDSGSFYLDVLYAPSFVTEGPSRRYVLLGDSLSLLCGTGLDSNPPATITWRDPNRTKVMDNARYNLENGPEVVRLNFTHTIPSDTGVWVCEAQTVSDKYIVSNGQLIRQDGVVIGTATVNIQLTVIIPPGEPTQLSVDSIGATWAHICWTAPINSTISRYEILAREVDGSGLVNVTTDNNSTLFNVTGLLPATNYSFSIVAVAEGGGIVVRSVESEPQEDTTGVTVPELTCSVSESETNGDIIVMWSFVHTGGQPLTALLTNYTFSRGLAESSGGVVVDNLNSFSAMISGLVVGIMYDFTVTARNDNGPATASCGSIFHRIGIPARPDFETPESGPGAGEVTLRISTSSSGVSLSEHNFTFIVTPVLGGDRQDSMRIERPNYMSGDVETIRVSELERGSVYTFSATAVNIFGESEAANSPPVTAAGQAITSFSPPSSSSSGGNNDSAAVVGGAVGGILLLVIIIAVLVVVVVALVLFRGRGGDYRPNKKEGVRYEPAPTSDGKVRVEEAPVDIGEDMEKGIPKENELQYAELETFRPPSRQKNGTETKPIESEEPVEYATITGFKKVEDTPSAVPDPAPTSPTAVTDSADKAGTSTTVV